MTSQPFHGTDANMAVVHPSMQQEELAALFSRNLTFDQPAPVPVEAPREEQKIIYISQHYNHSAHIARQDAQPPMQSPRPASEPPHPEHSVAETVLRDHGVDPSGLSSAQLQLFKTVDDPQKLKLIELWRICPPTNSIDNPTLAWSMTSVSQEEILARMRYEQRQRAEQETVMSLDGTPLTPIQAGDGRWVAMSQSYMEPYMSSGYEDLARREYEESAQRAYAEAMEQPKDIMYSPLDAATGGPNFNPAHSDPVYRSSSAAEVEWRRQEAMADQYGRMMAMRNNDEEML